MPCSIGSNYILDVGAVLAEKRGISLEKANSIYAKVSLCCDLPITFLTFMPHLRKNLKRDQYFSCLHIN